MDYNIFRSFTFLFYDFPGFEVLFYGCTGDVYEQGVFLSVKQKDEAAFERNFLQLKTFYTDAR